MEKHLIILSIIIIIIVFYYLYCNQNDNKETFTSSPIACGADITTLATLARNLQSTTEDATLSTSILNLKNKHVLSSDNDGWLRLKLYSDLNQKADLAVKNLNVVGNFNLLPRGIIVAWNNSVVPFGWTLCDGTYPTPDLRGRFILGQGQGNGLTNRVSGDISGFENITLNINQIPAHTHTYDIPVLGTDVGDERPRIDVYSTSTVKNTGSTGSGLPFNNMPPYYVLTYIMKL